MYLSSYVVHPFLRAFCLIYCFFFLSCRNIQILQEVKPLPHYPSASGIEILNNRIYIIGDDANNLLVLDSNLNAIDSISLYSFPEKRIPKAVKPDLEAIAVLPGGKLFLAGSGSLTPCRNTALIIDPVTRQIDSIRLDTFYQRLTSNSIEELNIEGMTVISAGIILSCRGSKGYPVNHLIFTRHNFWLNQSKTEINVTVTGANTDSTSFSGISGLGYSQESDILIMTLSTEDTRNRFDDGTIGKSYLWIVKNISSKRMHKTILPDKIIDLDAMDSRFKGQKIESVCIMKETKKQFHLLLAADNDNGSSTLFRLTVGKE